MREARFALGAQHSSKEPIMREHPAAIAFRRDRRGQRCKVIECNRTIKAKGAWLGLCTRCAQAHRRHGAVKATVVRAAELKTHLKAVAAVRRRNPDVAIDDFEGIAAENAAMKEDWWP
jgi:hypothetical protein